MLSNGVGICGCKQHVNMLDVSDTMDHGLKRQQADQEKIETLYGVLFLILNHIMTNNLQLYQCSKIKWYVVLTVIQMIGVILLIRLKRLEVLGSYAWKAVLRHIIENEHMEQAE